MIKCIQLAIIQAFTALKDEIRANSGHFEFLSKDEEEYS